MPITVWYDYIGYSTLADAIVANSNYIKLQGEVMKEKRKNKIQLLQDLNIVLFVVLYIW